MNIKLYHHKTSGGAEYLSDKFITCPNGEKEGLFEGAEYIVRLDGQPELMLRNSNLNKAAPTVAQELKESADWLLSLANNPNVGDFELRSQFRKQAEHLLCVLSKATS